MKTAAALKRRQIWEQDDAIDRDRRAQVTATLEAGPGKKSRRGASGRKYLKVGPLSSNKSGQKLETGAVHRPSQVIPELLAESRAISKRHDAAAFYHELTPRQDPIDKHQSQL